MEPKRIDYRVQSTVLPEYLHMTDYDVLIRTNITTKEVSDEIGNGDITKIYEYTEIAYDKNQYLSKLAEESSLPIIVNRDAMSDAELTSYLKKYFNQQCELALSAGITVDISELGTQQFSCKLEDQINIEALVKGINADTTQVYYHANGDKCRLYDIELFAEIVGKIFIVKYQQTAYCNLLKSYIETEATLEEKLTIDYGDIPSEEFNNELTNIVIQGVSSTLAGFITPNEIFNNKISSVVSYMITSN